MLKKPISYVPSVGPEDAMVVLDTIAEDIISGARTTAYLAVFKSMPPLTEDEGQRYVDHVLMGTEDSAQDLKDRYYGYGVREYPFHPIHGEQAREVLAEFILWAQRHHTDDPETVALMIAIPHKEPTGWNLQVFSRDKIHARLLTMVDEVYEETTWDHRDIPSHIYTYIPNPFSASTGDIGRLRGDL